MAPDTGTEQTATCPFCDSRDTEMRQRKGTAICRAVYYCNACNQPFEEMR